MFDFEFLRGPTLWNMASAPALARHARVEHESSFPFSPPSSAWLPTLAPSVQPLIRGLFHTHRVTDTPHSVQVSLLLCRHRNDVHGEVRLSMGLRPELVQNETAAAGNLIQTQTSRVQGRSVVGLVQVSHVAPRSMPCSLTALRESHCLPAEHREQPVE
jgi:hypothetical protein